MYQYVKKSQSGVRYYQWRPSNRLNTRSSGRYLLNGPASAGSQWLFIRRRHISTFSHQDHELGLDQALIYLGRGWWVGRRVGDVYCWQWVEWTVKYLEEAPNSGIIQKLYNQIQRHPNPIIRSDIIYGVSSSSVLQSFSLSVTSLQIDNTHTN